MSKLVVKSSDVSDSPADIEDKLEKAFNSIQLQRDKKEFSDVFLKSEKDKADSIILNVFESLISELANVLSN
mgnify:FL=1